MFTFAGVASEQENRVKIKNIVTATKMPWLSLNYFMDEKY